MFPCRGQFVHLTESPTDQVQKHSETALDTQKKEDTESSFPVKMHAIVHHYARSSVKFHTFTDELKKLAQNSPSGGASVVQKGKRKMQMSENQALAFLFDTRSRSPVIVVF